MSSLDLRRIGGALSQIWAGGSGPTRAQVQSALMIAGYEGQDTGNKQALVQQSISEANDTIARLIVEELLSLLRESGYFSDEDERAQTARLIRSMDLAGHELSEDGFISWSTPRSDGLPEDSEPTGSTGTAIPPQLPLVPSGNTATLEVASPDLMLLMSSLRRLGSGATRPIVNRRRQGRPGIAFEDEYDVQDIVEVLLRCLYSDVRREEPTPSSAGSSSRMDLHLREGSTAIEVKVTAAGRDEKKVKPEILIDINDYREHPRIQTLVVVVYDLAGTFVNPAGFENDLTGNRDGLDVHVIVVPWVGPLAPG